MAFATYRHVRTQTGTAEAATATYVWDGSSGDGLWSTAANWTPAGPPGPGDTAIIADTSDDIDYDVSGSGVKILAIGVGHTGNITSSYTLSADEIHVRKRAGNVDLNTGSSVGRSLVENLYVYRTSGGSSSLRVGGKYKNVVILSGVVSFQSTLTQLDETYIVPPRNRTATVTIEKSATFGSMRIHQNGFVTTTAGGSTLDMFGRAQFSLSGNQPWSTVTTSGDCLIRWTGSNDITTWKAYGGRLSTKGNTTEAVFSGLTVDLYSEAILDSRSGVDAPFGISGGANYYGGVVRTDEGRTITVA